MKPMSLPAVGRPVEEELRRDVRCAHCGLIHAVFGLATWCPDCGCDIFMAHVRAELEVLRHVLGAVESRKEMLGPRAAARDVENTLEDLVSVGEAVLKVVTRRHLLLSGRSEAEISDLLERQIRNGFQNLARVQPLVVQHTGGILGRSNADGEFDWLCGVLEKRHPITQPRCHGSAIPGEGEVGRNAGL
jgi:predicted  nucleic acid-binding Zn-ribbon protein